jgi:GAF domain-containing protein/anti-sigma regulatory factor (Ser/Thr protein kinase)
VAAGLHAVAAVPVVDVDAATIGSIGFAWPAPQTFDAARRADLANLAALCSQALRRALEHGRVVQARQRAEQLQLIASRLSRALTSDDIVRAVSDGATTTFGAAVGGVHLRDPDDPNVLRLASTSPARHASAMWPAVPVRARTPLSSAVRRRGSVYAPTPDEIVRRWPTMVDGVRGETVRAVAAVPLSRGTEIVGALWLSFVTPEALDANDRVALDGLAAIAGQALTRAQRYESDHNVAVTLQRSLLESRPPRHPFVHVVTHYQPGTEGIEVGGDLHDAFETPDGSLVLVVGDVVGHGVKAAAAMGQLRSAVRALVPSCAGPAEVLGRLDNFVASVPDLFFATVLCAIITPAADRMVYAAAGHPPLALKHPEGDVELLLDGRSPPLGVGDPEKRAEAKTSLRRGAMICAITDGLIERRGEAIDVGLERLRAFLARLERGRADSTICEEIVANVLPAGGQQDDVALMCAVVLPHPRFSYQLSGGKIDTGLEALAEARRALRGWLDDVGIDGTARDEMILATGEAVANAVEHPVLSGPRGDVLIDAMVGSDSMLTITIENIGQWPTHTVGRGAFRGHGLQIMQQLADITVETDADRTTVVLRRPVPGAVSLDSRQ